MFNLINLSQVRQEMTDEVNEDVRKNSYYKSPRLNAVGLLAYPGALRSAVTSGTPDSFSKNFSMINFSQTEQRNRPNGGVTTAKVPDGANATLCEGEFNRYYIRGVCLKALLLGNTFVVAYRARHSDNPRQESVLLEEKQIDAAKLLADLRRDGWVDKAMGLPPGPNSGMSAKLMGS